MSKETWVEAYAGSPLQSPLALAEISTTSELSNMSHTPSVAIMSSLYICVYIYSHTHTHTHRSLYVYIGAYMYIFMSAYICMYIRIYTYRNTCTYRYTQIHINIIYW